MKLTSFHILTLAAAALVSASCSDSEEVFGVPPIKQPLPPAVTVQGTVTTDAGAPLANVAVSDGHTITFTDAQGNYSLLSTLDLGYVFVSTPDGYEPATFLDNNRPQFWLNATKSDCTGKDFKLRAIGNKGKLAIVGIADPQISNRCGDVELLQTMYVPEINKAVSELRAKGMDPIVLTMGDIICDWFVANGYGYTLDKFNADFQVNAPVYHTMGNHDNDPFIAGDLPGSSTWHKFNGPSYYSFNRGGVHFISCDNIVYINAGAGDGKPGNRDCTTAITAEQLAWIEADLATVKDKTAPLFIMMHGILLTYPVAEGGAVSRVYRFNDGGPELGAMLAEFTDVKQLSGHSHKSHFNVTPEGNIREYNYAGANGGWWPAGAKPWGPNFDTCFDGAPWGMGIWDFSGATPTHLYRGFLLPDDYQIRAYDLNCVNTGASTAPNQVLANVWAYEPGATVKMYEDGVELTVRRIAAKDPYVVLKITEPLHQQGYTNSGFDPESTAHMFRAQASTADKPVTIEFTDRYGRTFTTVLNRPASL